MAPADKGRNHTCVAKIPHTESSWLTMQSAANQSPHQIPC